MAVNRLTGCSAIIVPRRIAHAAHTKCPIRLLVALSPARDLLLRAKHLFLVTMVGIVATEPSRRGTGPLNRTWLHRKRAHLLAVGEGACADPWSRRRSGPANCPFGCGH